MKIQNKAYIFILLLVFGLIFSPVRALTENSSITYSTIPALDCVINPYRVADLASPVAGVIDEINVQRSQQVTKGQMLAQLKADVERANVELAKFRSHLKSEVELSRVNLDFDQRRKSRVDSLKQQQAISDESDDEARREANISRWKLEQARELSRVRKLELSRAIEQLQQKTIKAPFSGFVLDTFKLQGEYVDDQAILRLAQLDPLVVEAIVPMENFGAVSVGMLAEIVPEVLIDTKLQAKVTIVDRMGDTASNTFGVRLVLPNPDHKIPAGLKCIVKFIDQVEAPEPVESLETEAPVSDTASLDATAQDPVALASEPVEKQGGEPVRTTPSGYLVVTRQDKAVKGTRDLINRLHKSGINDLLKVDKGSYKGLILLGLYNNRDVAERRRKDLEALGFNVYVQERQ